MHAAELVQLLDRSDYFKGLSAENKRALTTVCLPRTLKKRETLFLEGQQGEAVYLLASGSIQLFKTSMEGREIVIKTVTAGEVFAEVILFERDSYPVSAVALKPSLVYRLPRREFHRLLQHEAFRSDFVAMLMRRLRYLTDRILYLTLYDVRERFFLFLEEQYGRHEHYEVLLSKRDIAAAIFTTPETLSRLILNLKQEELLTWEGKAIRLRAGFWERWESE